MEINVPVVVDAVRSPLGRRNGVLSGWHPVDLMAEVLNGVVARTGIDPAIIDDVIVGCVSQVGAQSFNIGRNAVLAAGWPETVTGTTIDRQCGSSQQAIHFAAQGVMAGVYDVVVAAGVESMSVVPMFSNTEANLGDPYGPRIAERYADRSTYGESGLVPQGLSAELMADQWSLTRDELDEFSARSHRRAAAARDAGTFEREILPVAGKARDRDSGEVIESGELVIADMGIRDDSTPELLAKLQPAFLPTGKLTAGNSSQISDGSAAVLVMSERRAQDLGLRARARFVGFSLAGVDPVLMLDGPIAATQKVLARAGLSTDDIDLYEVNEAFSPVVLAWQRELGIADDRVNVNGGAIALGHPLGASGARVFTTLLHELERRGGRYGVQAICEGGGMANGTLIERI